MTRYAQHVSRRRTPQSEPVSSDQKKNNAGGYAFTLDCWTRLDRWLILGAEGGSYYVNERKLSKDNYASLKECLDANGPKTVTRIVEISKAGRAPKNDPAIFALAVAASHSHGLTRDVALKALPEVCRIGTHLFDFLNSVQEFRGWGRGLRRGVADWYLEKEPDKLGYQVAKYRQRNGWTHRDVLRKAGGMIPADHPNQAILRWVVTGLEGLGPRTVKRDEAVKEYVGFSEADLPAIIQGYEACRGAKDAKAIAKLVAEYRLTHEMVPTEFLKSPEVWDALLQTMPLGALVRNLGRLTALGNLAPFSDGQKKAVALLQNGEAIKKARLHPMSALKALKQYQKGQGDRGKLMWEPVAQIQAALEDAFYLGFDAIEPADKNIVIGLDVSGSMSGNWGGAIDHMSMSPREVAAVMAMVTMRTEPAYEVMAFSDSFVPLNITAKDSLADVIAKTSGLPFGRTDCALPMLWATEKKIPADAFYVYTDNETWFGHMHPHVALEQFRQKMGRDAKLVVVGMTATEFTIADPNDPGMLDVVGFDTAAPAVMANFTRDGFGG